LLCSCLRCYHIYVGCFERFCRVMSSYAELLKDPRWQKKRLEVLSNAEWQCEECQDSESTLNVHHCLYQKGKKPWEYEDYHLKALCDSCHKELHKQKAEFQRVSALANAIDYEEMAGYFLGMDWRYDWPCGTIKLGNASIVTGFCNAMHLDEQKLISLLMQNNHCVDYDLLTKNIMSLRKK